MAHADRPAAQRLITSARPRLAAFARPWLMRDDMRAAVQRTTRSQWRALRRVLLNAAAPAVLQALLRDQLNRLRLQPSPAEPWSLPEALSALSNAKGLQLFGVLRLLQAAQPKRERLGYALNPDLEPARIDQPLLMGFAASEVHSVAPVQGLQIAGRTCVQQHAVGLLGPNGPLPYAWTQFAFEMGRVSAGQAGHERHSFLAFLNVVQRRQLAFLYRAWSDAQAVAAFDASASGQNLHPVAGRLLALAGMAHAKLAERDQIAPEFKQAFAGTLSRRVRNPAALAGMMASYFDVPMNIEEFVPRWLDIPSAQQSSLGLCYSELGTDAVVGDQVWSCTSRFRIVVGPMALKRYHEFLPGGRAYREARDLVSLYAGPEWEWEFSLVLRADEVPDNLLAGDEPQPRLGWTTWLGKRLDKTDAADLQLRAAAGLAPNAEAAEA
jgi:type VI secretion system protein ImpH